MRPPELAVRVLGVPIGIRAEQPLSGEVADLFADLPSCRPDTVAVTVQTRDGDRPPDVLASVTQAAVARSPLLCVHAGVVSLGDRLVVIPAVSGTGKTTLTAALVRAGFGYVSDEALAVDRLTHAVTAFPRPLALAADVLPLLGLPPAPDPDVEHLVRASELGSVDPDPGRVTDLLLVRRDGSGPTLTRSPRSRAVVELLHRSFNHYVDPLGSFHAAVGLARTAHVWSASYADAPDLAAVLAEELRASGRGRRP